ncbi:MAG: hypothetical protein LBT66_04325 [Methanobrevibacter sp.]|nr:hypothetical protein [Candidatus Methanovirga meridionalis]
MVIFSVISNFTEALIILSYLVLVFIIRSVNIPVDLPVLCDKLFICLIASIDRAYVVFLIFIVIPTIL